MWATFQLNKDGLKLGDWNSVFVLTFVRGNISVMFRLVLFRENWAHLPWVPAHSGHVGAAGVAVPCAVRISGQAAFGAGLTVQLTLVQAELGHTLPRAHKQPLLQMGGPEGRGDKERSNGRGLQSELYGKKKTWEERGHVNLFRLQESAATPEHTHI